MNQNPFGLGKHKIQPMVCPLVHLGYNNGTNKNINGALDEDNYNSMQNDHYTANKKPMQMNSNNLNTNSTYYYYDQHNDSYSTEELNYNKTLEESNTHLKNLDLSSENDDFAMNLRKSCLNSNYWEEERCCDKLKKTSSILGETVQKNYLKLSKFNPNVDQGYHTLVSTSPGPLLSYSAWTDGQNPYKGKKNHSKNNSFDHLSDKILVRIFSFLSSVDLSICAQVCRRFEILAWTPILWRIIRLEGDKICGDKAVRGVLRQLCGQGRTGACPSVERVHVTDGAKLSDKSLLLLSRRCPELTHLQLHGCLTVTNNALFEIATRCANLQHLDVSGCIKISCISINSGPEPPRRLQLQYLDLTDCIALQDSGLEVIVHNCPQLAYFYLRRCMQITDAGLKFVPSFCHGLRELSVSDCSNITDFGLYELAKLGATLRYLSVAKCDQVSDAGLKVIARRCYKLRYLNVRGCEAVSDDAMTVLARSCTRLRALDIGKCDVSDAGLRALAESCPNLKKLSLRNCDLVTDRGIHCIAYYCRGLQQLNIQDCQISLEGYRAVKQYCKRCVIEHTNPGFF
ncbi:unnamed protein product [Brassicogethes aeneus]|uniref:F-box domain-containing protein n=1 Tax=Brassicogethes aeneus TaxID=1431903 RepID=A0A9P0FLS7_BRAAE|nr:unnamed protein product [Brassicogethes aeneus]